MIRCHSFVDIRTQEVTSMILYWDLDFEGDPPFLSGGCPDGDPTLTILS